MPELPEVELISRSLNTLVKGRRILTALLLRDRLAPHTTPGAFAADLTGQVIRNVCRRGKHILFDLSGSKTLIVHLRMSGRFSLLDAESANPKFTHAVFHFADGSRLVFDDQRHFGMMRIVSAKELFSSPELRDLAPEPFSDEFSVNYLFHAAKRCRRSLKDFLLDQTKVCGLGNIYACEAMFLSGLNPRRLCTRLSRSRAEILHANVLATLRAAIDYGSARTIDPTNLEGSYFSGSDEKGWFVYDREGLSCIKCTGPIVRVRQGGRSTYYCRHCQRV